MSLLEHFQLILRGRQSKVNKQKEARSKGSKTMPWIMISSFGHFSKLIFGPITSKLSVQFVSPLENSAFSVTKKRLVDEGTIASEKNGSVI